MIKGGFDFNQRPFLVICETTHACELVCKHCRAQAQDWPQPDELTTQEAKKLISDVAALRTPIIVFSGGDPLRRTDLPELVSYAKSVGLRTGAIPAASKSLSLEKLI